MKTKKQVDDYLEHATYTSIEDFRMISGYCMKTHRMSLHQPDTFYPDSDKALDCLTFIEWVKDGYGGGDLVYYDNSLCLVSKAYLHNITICLKIGERGSSFDSFSLDDKLVTRAEKSAQKRINEVLLENGKEFEAPFYVITDKYIPKSNTEMYFHRINGTEEGYGYVRMIDEKKNVHVHCLMSTTRGLMYGEDVIMGNIKDYRFAIIGFDKFKKRMEESLNEMEKTWNLKQRRIEPLHMRAGKGEKYYYISDRMRVATATETGSSMDNMRYYAGNYSTLKEQMNKLLQRGMELIKQMLAEPTSAV